MNESIQNIQIQSNNNWKYDNWFNIKSELVNLNELKWTNNHKSYNKKKNGQ